MHNDLINQIFIKKLSAELLTANIELFFQNTEKEKRAAELLIANKELSFQNKEKEKRAAELLTANIELSFQNEEKEKRAAELLVAKKEIFAQSELIKIQESYFIDKQLFEATLLSIGDAVITCDSDCNIMFINNVTEMLSGWKQEEVKGMPIDNVLNIINGITRDKSDNMVKKAIIGRQIVSLADNTVLICKDGSEKYIEDSVAPIFQKNGNVVGAVLVFRDISDKMEKLKDIEYLSFHDMLTGVYNRRFYEEELYKINIEENLPLTIAMGDVDGLKLINDSFGHKTGDELLKKAAEVIKFICRADDIIARVGGDEFIIIFPKTNTAEAEIIIKRIKNILSELKISGLDISISFGCKTKDDMVSNIDEIYKNAEDAMYRQKLYISSSLRSKTVDIIMNTLYEKNHREMFHSIRVGEICANISEKMGFSSDNILRMRLAGKMHDIGKIGIDEKILNKIGRLEAAEFDEIKRHSEIGFRILSSVNEFSEIADYVLAHHERWDGTGYPKGLKGKEIPIQARIIAVSDSYDAMINERTYKKVLNENEASDEIKRCSGNQFDPEIAKIFLDRVIKTI